MNTIRTLFILLTLFLEASVVDAGDKVYTLQVDGLGCPFCAYGIEKKLSGIKDVKNIEVDLKNAQVIVTMDNDAHLDQQQARQAVLDAGFTLRSFSQHTRTEEDGP